MRNRRQFVGSIAILVVLSVLIGISAISTHLSFASSTPVRNPAKNNYQILPKKLTPHANVPANTVSLYESTTNPVTMYNQGCSAAKGTPGLVILDWGEPIYFGGNTYGTYDFGGHFDTDNDILHAIANYAQGVWYCRTRTTDIAIGIGLSNYYSDYSMPLTTSAWYADGQQWGQMVNNVQSFISNNHYSVVGANAAGDFEVEWVNFQLSSSWINGYNNATSHIFFDFGDDSPGWWSNYDVWYIAYGAKDSLPLPEIYYDGNAVYDWEPLDIWACNNEGGPIYFKGIMSEYVSGTNSPYQAFSDLYNAEASNSCTARDMSGMIFTTEMYHTGQV
jgi:hypothetical protein